jgi:hypothetical protein
MPAPDDLLRFPSAVRHDPTVDAWLRAQREDLRPDRDVDSAALARLVDAACADIRARLRR